MRTLYEQRDPIKDEVTGEIVGYNTQAVVFPDTLPLMAGLKFDWDNNTIERNGKVYYMDKMEMEDVTAKLPKTDEWLSTYGNTIERKYYSGLIGEYNDNPSGNTENIKQSIYKANGVVKYIIEYKYDSNDNIVEQSSRAPIGSESTSAGDIEKDDADVFDDSSRLPSYNLLSVPSYNASVSNNKLTYVADKKHIILSQTGRKKPLYSDGVRVDSSVSAVIVSISNANWLGKVYITDLNGDVLTQADITGETKFDMVIDNKALGDYKYINIVLSHKTRDIDKLTYNEIRQSEIGLQIVLKGYKTLIVDDEVNGVQSYVYPESSEVDLSAIRPADSDTMKFEHFTFEGSELDGNIVMDYDKTIVAVYSSIISPEEETENNE